ncbi:putative major facilitator superfamily transporter [Rosellinia necatrix]|uniref:Putative major facilitator superfamily transporter n=1 Tax=Rosellinia necatrix TaxID=77044 RepID=A0A1W2TMC9_ROSNE|nr:putative major facilitator superfamily transporter [Rosellinia necatrix]
MATAGQYSSGYTAVPPAAGEQVSSTADVADENRYAPQQDTTGWGYQHDHGAGAPAQAAQAAQTTGYGVEGQWQYQGAYGGYGSIYPTGHLDQGGHAQYAQAAVAPNQTAQWDHQYYQSQVDGVAVPQAVYYGQEGWAFYGNGAQYWNHNGVAQPVHAESLGSNVNQYQYMEQQHIRPTNQAYIQAGNYEPPTNGLNSDSTLSTNKPSLHPDGWQHRTALIDPIISESHPRQSLTAWQWRLMFIASNILSLVNGYDVSNVANIQAPIYEAFEDIRLLPWLALSYSVCNVVVTPLTRKLFKFYDIKVLTISGLILLVAGNALAGAAPSLLLLIIGRSIMAFGASLVYQGILSFSMIFSYPGEIALVHASFGASFAFGILTGPVIGAGFAQNEHTTWRWSFYICLPVLVIALLLSVYALPSYSASTEKSVSKHFKEIDWIGHVLHSGTFISFSLATVFSGSAWPWGSIPQLAVWVIVVTVAVAYIVQQTFSIGIKPQHRILPVHLLKKRIVLLTFLCTLGAAITYGVTLYYTPLFYVFTRGIEPLEAGLRLLCFTALFIAAIFLSHALLPLARFYMPFFVFGGALLVAGGIAHHSVNSQTSLAAIMAFSALLGAGVGALWNLAIPVCSAVLETQEERLDQTTLHSIAQLGGTALSLSISASVYRNIGLKLVKDAVGFAGFQDDEILALLSGAKSTMLDAFSPEVRELVIEALVETISRLYFVVIGGASLCFIAAILLKIEPLQFKRWIRTKDPEKGEKGSQKEQKAVYVLR